MLARVEIRETVWQTFLGEPGPMLYSVDPAVETMRGNGQLTQVEATSPPDFVLIDCIGSESDIQAFYDYFAPADRGQIWRWGFDGKVDFDTEYEGQQNDILATQPSGATFENPKWEHGWMGQGQNRFAREFSREFGEDFA